MKKTLMMILLKQMLTGRGEHTHPPDLRLVDGRQKRGYCGKRWIARLQLLPDEEASDPEEFLRACQRRQPHT